MASVQMSRDALRARLARWAGRLDVAAVNGPGSAVVSGDVAALREFLAGCDADEIRARRIEVDYASHSAHVEGVRDQLLDALADIAPRDCDIAFYSAVTGSPLPGSSLDAGDWYRNLRQTVEFEQAARALAGDGYGLFIEASPHPVLSPGLAGTLMDAGTLADNGTELLSSRPSGGTREASGISWNPPPSLTSAAHPSTGRRRSQAGIPPDRPADLPFPARSLLAAGTRRRQRPGIGRAAWHGSPAAPGDDRARDREGRGAHRQALCAEPSVAR